MSKTILVARRPFKSMGVFYPMGSVITDPTRIKLLRTKLTEGKIVELLEGDPETAKTIAYIESRAGVALKQDILDGFKDPEPEPAKVPPKAKQVTKPATKTADKPAAKPAATKAVKKE